MKYPTIHLIKRIFQHARRFWLPILATFLLTLLASPIALLKPLGMKIVIDSAFGPHPLPEFIRMFFPPGFDFTFSAIVVISAALIIMVALIDNINGYFIWLLSTSTGEKLVLHFRTLLFNHIQRLSIAYHDSRGTSDSLYRIQWDTMCIRSLLLNQLSPLLSAFITLVSMIGVMLFINWRFALIALCVIPPLYFLSSVGSRRMRKEWYKVKDAESSAISVIHEVLGSLRVVKAFGQEENESERFSMRSGEAVEGQVRMARLGAFFQFLTGMTLTIGTALFVYMGAYYVQAGQMTLGDLTLVIAYLAQVFGPLQTISKNINEVQSSLVSIDRVFSVLDEEKEVEERSDAMPLQKVKGEFDVRNVSFHYRKDKTILDRISFRVHSGDRVGIMGSTGAGKSTLISLLNRFYDPSEGVILLDGTDIRSYQLKDYRSQFSIVLQEPVLFSSTISENIRYGRPDATEEEIIEAARMANAYDFIVRSQDGYQTLVGERGMQLSGGERQRISIARAFIKNAPLLILDEPTSSLDIRTEAQIMDAMERLMKGRTTFMITHRLDTLKTCNLILHLEGGHLAEVVRGQTDEFLAAKKDAFLSHSGYGDLPLHQKDTIK
ncbi:MAG: ABC transporter ATP-binding protein/permease [Bacteroidetes bacterium]|nr:ABC transporter ATP-binding protein/permease [Bacteroidota bacterium]